MNSLEMLYRIKKLKNWQIGLTEIGNTGNLKKTMAAGENMRKKAAIIGAGIMDVLVNPVDAEVFQKGSVPVEHIKISTGGDALNEATVLSRICKPSEGNQVYLVSLLGKDEAGQHILEHCRNERISVEYIVTEDTIETGVNVVMIQKDGNRSFFTNPQSSLRKLALSHIPEKFPEDVAVVCLASMFVSPLLRVEEMEQLFQRVKEQGIVVCADMTKCKNQETAEDMQKALRYLDYLFANKEEAQLLTGKANPEEMAEIFWDCGVKHIIIKCGSEGCYVKTDSVQGYYPAVSGVHCVDTTGAGDSFAAGFLCALLEEKTFEECVAWGNVCGSLAVENVGACEGIQSRRQVLERLETYKMEKEELRRNE